MRTAGGLVNWPQPPARSCEAAPRRSSRLTERWLGFGRAPVALVGWKPSLGVDVSRFLSAGQAWRSSRVSLDVHQFGASPSISLTPGRLTPRCVAGGPRALPRLECQVHAPVAQWKERSSAKGKAAGSIPAGGTHAETPPDCSGGVSLAHSVGWCPDRSGPFAQVSVPLLTPSSACPP